MRLSSESSQVSDMNSEKRHKEGDDQLGQVANLLRQYICDAMLQSETMQEVLPYFAEMSGSDSVTFDDYRRWVARLRNHEFADELVVAITAKKLRIPIVVVPSNADWVLQTHPDISLHHQLRVESANPIYLGTCDCYTHFCCLVSLRCVALHGLGLVICQQRVQRKR